MHVHRALFGAALALMAAAAPAMAQLLPVEGDAQRADAFASEVPALTWTLAEDRRAAVVFLDDAMTLLELAEDRLASGAPAVSELMAASGKITSAYLLLFRDRPGAEALRDLATRVGGAAPLATMAPGEAARLARDVRGLVQMAYRTQLANLGGGAGGFPEGLEHVDPEPVDPTEGEMP